LFKIFGNKKGQSRRQDGLAVPPICRSTQFLCNHKITTYLPDIISCNSYQNKTADFLVETGCFTIKILFVDVFNIHMLAILSHIPS